MTAINIIQQISAVHVITDGAVCNPDDGKLALEVAKVWPLPHLNAVIAVRGSYLAAPAILLRIGAKALSFDDLKKQISSGLNDECDRAELLAACGSFDLVVAGWSDSVGPHSYFMCNHLLHGGIEPWRVVDLNGVSLLPLSPAMRTEFDDAFPPGTNPHALDPIRDGLRMLEIQRRHLAPNADGSANYRTIGRFAQLTTITRAAIETRIIHRWPDVPGRAIE
jgi:hypothetical protein